MSNGSESWWPIWLAPLGGAMVTALLFGLLVAIGGPEMDFKFWLAIAFGGLLLSLPTLPTAWALGIATNYVFKRYSIVAAWAYALAGLALGIIGGAIWCVALDAASWRGFGIGDLPPGYAEPAPMGATALFGFAVLGATSGTATALIYWLMVRPDRGTPNPATSPP